MKSLIIIYQTLSPILLIFYFFYSYVNSFRSNSFFIKALGIEKTIDDKDNNWLRFSQFLQILALI